MTNRSMRWAVAALGGLALAACSAGPRTVATAPPPKGSVSDTDAAFASLMQGDEAGARKRLKAVLKRDPMSATGRLLTDSIDRDPKDLLGPQSFPYTVKPGDTVVSLAEHFLGNRLKAYQLARYNSLAAPVTLSPGQIVRIPGEPPRLEPVRRPELVPARAAPVASPRSKPVAAPATAPKPVAPTANPAAARQARAAGLAALNAGNVDRAVGLLRRAASLDPGNPLINRDLSRAERIAATVKARR